MGHVLKSFSCKGRLCYRTIVKVFRISFRRTPGPGPSTSLPGRWTEPTGPTLRWPEKGWTGLKNVEGTNESRWVASPPIGVLDDCEQFMQWWIISKSIPSLKVVNNVPILQLFDRPLTWTTNARFLVIKNKEKSVKSRIWLYYVPIQSLTQKAVKRRSMFDTKSWTGDVYTLESKEKTLYFSVLIS